MNKICETEGCSNPAEFIVEKNWIQYQYRIPFTKFSIKIAELYEGPSSFCSECRKHPIRFEKKG